MTPRAHTLLGEGVEFDHIRAVWDRLGRRMESSGDDCAFISMGPATLAISTDLTLEGVHFCPGWIDWKQLGYRAAAAAFSDLAAVAATPMGLMVSLGVPAELHNGVIPEIMDGVGTMADEVGARVWGGDTTRSEKVVIDLTVVGRVDGDPVKRGGARVGDRLYVTGSLGGPARALRDWLAGAEPPAWARQRFERPEPRIAEGQWLRGHGARAMIDISDGLVADAAHLAAASGLRCTIDLDSIPVAGDSNRHEAAAGGEEYELLVAMSPEPSHENLLIDFERTFRIPLSLVGACVTGHGVDVTEKGEPVTVSGYRHFP